MARHIFGDVDVANAFLQDHPEVEIDNVNVCADEIGNRFEVLIPEDEPVGDVELDHRVVAE
jgi:hypothetical protein